MRKSRSSLKGLLKKTLIVTVAALSLGANASVIQHSSDDYLKTQYDIIKVMFLDLDVTQPNTKEIRITIPTSYGFETGSFKLKRPIKDKLKELAKVLNDYTETTIDIVGHTDSVGTEISNMQLGQLRADRVGEILTSNKLSPLRIKKYSEGEDLPRCSNETLKGRNCNRRVEISIMLERELANY